jgi:ABC-type multidrug transport system fused ATPase/permease subunit
VAAPLVSIASIGTQISEAFAGLDRIREIRDMATEDDARRVQPADGRHPLDDVTEFRTGRASSTTPAVPVLKDVSFTAPAGSTTALVGSSGGRARAR